MLLVLNQVFVAMYIFEVIYRGTISYVTALHHIGTIMIASFAVVYSMSWESKPDATVEFIMCYVWGKPPLASTATYWVLTDVP